MLPWWGLNGENGERTTSPELVRKDRDLGRSIRTVVSVVVLAVAVVVGYNQVLDMLDKRIKQATSGFALESDVRLGNERVASELRSQRESRDRDQRELARYLSDLSDRMRDLERQRTKAGGR